MSVSERTLGGLGHFGWRWSCDYCLSGSRVDVISREGAVKQYAAHVKKRHPGKPVPK